MDRTAFLDQLYAHFAAPRAAVIELVQRVCGQRVAGVERLIHGGENEVYRAHLDGGGSVFLRISGPDTAPLKLYREAWAMEHARRAGVPVPDVLTVEPIASHEGDRHAMLVAAAAGQPLSDLLPSMPTDRRAATMREFGRVLARLHTVSMPGRGVPDDTGAWPDQAEKAHRRNITNRIAASDHLGEAGLTATETPPRMVYPWGDQPTPAKCHVRENGIGETTAQRLLSKGREPVRRLRHVRQRFGSGALPSPGRADTSSRAGHGPA